MDWDTAMNTFMTIRAHLEELQGLAVDNQSLRETNAELLATLKPFAENDPTDYYCKPQGYDAWIPRFTKAKEVYGKYAPKKDGE